MSILTSTWRQLVQRRLLPVVILLLAALVAVPLLLAKDPKPVSPAPAPLGDLGSERNAATAEPVVALAEDGDQSRRRRVLGASKDPFEPAPVKRIATPEPARGPVTTASADKPATGRTGGSAPASTAPSSPVGTTPPTAAPPEETPKRRHELYSLVVRFGSSEGDSLERMSLARLKPLPSAEEPILVYLGVSEDKKSALFMVDSSVEADGDGNCKPRPTDCETIALREGETEFFDVLGEDGEPVAQYQLDLVKIRRSTTTSAAKAATARAKVSQSGRKVPRAFEARIADAMSGGF